MIIKNADVYTQDNVFVKGDVVVDNGTFTKVLEAPDYVGNEVVDATGLKMIPGLVDIHFHEWEAAHHVLSNRIEIALIVLVIVSWIVTLVRTIKRRLDNR